MYPAVVKQYKKGRSMEDRMINWEGKEYQMYLQFYWDLGEFNRTFDRVQRLLIYDAQL